jgi:hypothetical protein
VGHLRDQIAQNPAGNLGVIVTTWDNGELSLHCLVSSMLFHDVHNIWESGPDNLVVNVTVPGEAGTADVSVPQEYRWRFLLGLIGQSGMSTLIHAMTSSTAVTRIAYFGHVAAWLDGIGKAVPLDSVFCRNRGDHRYISRYDVRTTTWKIRSDVATVSTNPMAARWNQILGYTSAEQPGCSTSSTIPDSWESIFRGLHRAAPSIQWGSESGDVGRPSFWGLFSDYSGGSSDAESEDPYGRKIRVVRSESSWGSMESSPSPR